MHFPGTPKKADKIKELNTIKVINDYWKSLITKIPYRHKDDLCVLMEYFEKILIAGISNSEYKHLAKALFNEPFSAKL